MLWYGQTGYRKRIIIPNCFSILCHFLQRITIRRFPDLRRNPADHWQRTAVKGTKTSLPAFHKASDRFFQFGPTQLTSVSRKSVWHDHGARHFFRISCLPHISRKAVCCRDQHIRTINTAQSVCHNRICRIAPTGMKTVGICFL